MNGPDLRLAIVRSDVPVELDGAVLVESWSNDTWVTDSIVLRVCWRGDRERMLRERALLDSLPSSVPHAVVLDAGRTEDLTWMALHRIRGERLDVVWPQLSVDEQRDAVVSLGLVLCSLHEWVPPPEVREMMWRASSTVPTERDAIVGSALVPLPAARLSPLLDHVDELPGMDEMLASRARRRIDELRTVVADRELHAGVAVHGDAHFANVLWHEGRLVALLDFEWARLGPRDLELEAACREDPVIEARVTDGPVAASDVPMLVGLRVGYPELFEREDLTERLWLYELCYQVRQLCNSGAGSARASELDRLRILASGPRVQFR